jgi:hypothetical protein
MADTIQLDLRPDMVSSPRFRVTCVTCNNIDYVVMGEHEAYKMAYEHIDGWPGHSVFIHPITLIQKWNDGAKPRG